jgi:hypothetical protein
MPRTQLSDFYGLTQNQLNDKALNEWLKKQAFVENTLYGEYKKYLELLFFSKYGEHFSIRDTRKMWDNYTQIIQTIYDGNYEI